MLNRSIASGKRFLAEGAQGTFLDNIHGTYPFVTSSQTIAGAAFTGLGISSFSINQIVGVTKAYTTRVGGGPFPTELFDNVGKYLAGKGGKDEDKKNLVRYLFDNILNNDFSWENYALPLVIGLVEGGRENE